MADDFKDQDHYLLLGLDTIDTIAITTAHIQQAYRKKALKYHPDKNKHKSTSEQATAATMFQKISKANEILGNETTRADYDNVVNAKKLRKRKEMEMNADRRKMTDGIQQSVREEEHKAQQQQKRKPAPEPEDLSWLNKSKPFRMPKGDTTQPATTSPPSGASGFTTIKVKWSKKKKYTKEEITNTFSKFGDIDFVIISEEKRKGRPNALISFKNPLHAQSAIQSKISGFKLSWPATQPDTPTPPPQQRTGFQTPGTPFFSPFSNHPYGTRPPYASPFASPFASPNFKSPFASPFGTAQAASPAADLEDLEMQTLMRLQKAAKLQKDKEQKEQQPPPQPPASEPTTANNNNSDNSNGSYFHPLNLDDDTPSSTPTKDASNNNNTNNNSNNNGYSYFHPTDFESLEERTRRHAIERQTLLDELSGGGGGGVVNS